MAYRIGDRVQSLDRVTGQWHSAVLEDVSNNKGRIAFSDLRRADEWKKLGDLSAGTRQVLSVDCSLRSFCQRADDERNECLPGRRRIMRGNTTFQQQISAYLLENMDNSGEVSGIVCQRLNDIGSVLYGETFLKLMEIVVEKLYDYFTKEDLIRTPIPVRMMKRSLGIGHMSPSTSRQLCRDDEIWFAEGDEIKRGQVDTNDQFKCSVTTPEGTVIPYENLQKPPEDSFVLQLSASTVSDDDTAADPDWAVSRNFEESEVDDEVADPPRKRKAANSTKITSTLMVKGRKEAVKRRRITILGSGKPFPRPTEPIRINTSPQLVSSPSRSVVISPSLPSPSATSNSSSDGTCHQELSVEVALLRADVNTILDNQRRILDMLSVMSRSSSTATRKREQTSSLTDPRVWDIHPADLPETLNDTTVKETIEKPTTGDAVTQAKDACGGTRESLAKELFSRLFTLGDSYGRNVYGRAMGRTQPRKPMKKELIETILDVCFQVFPSHSQGKKASSACVNAINTYNRYLWNRRLSSTTLPELPGRYNY